MASTSPTAGKVAIITGASSGIGRCAALQFIEAGVKVVGVARGVERLQELADYVGDEDRLQVIALDVTQGDAPHRIINTALDKWGRLDYLINNAGEGSPKPLHEADDEHLDLLLDVMLRAPFRLSREAVTKMTPGGAIINVSSTYGILGGLRGGAYCAAKAGLDGLTRHIACQYGASGIRSNSVAPGVTATPMVEASMQNLSFRRMNQEMTPHTRLAKVEDVAATIFFLCSEGAEFINGQTIAVDGGWTTTKWLSEHGRTSVWTDPT